METVFALSLMHRSDKRGILDHDLQTVPEALRHRMSRLHPFECEWRTCRVLGKIKLDSLSHLFEHIKRNHGDTKDKRVSQSISSSTEVGTDELLH